MITTLAGYSRWARGLFAGDQSNSGNGVALVDALTGLRPSVGAVGDDTTVSLGLKVQTAAATYAERFIANAAAKTIVDGSATSLCEVACASGEIIGGFIDFLVRASDGTDHQAIAGRAAYAGVNKAGTHTLTITYTTAPEAKAVSSGTLTLAFTIVTGTNKATIKLQPTGSLTETVYTIEYNVQPICGAVTIL
ncbi:MAG: hypothetical protein ABL982_00035 [Vicinamibacterales bacterium]